MLLASSSPARGATPSIQKYVSVLLCYSVSSLVEAEAASAQGQEAAWQEESQDYVAVQHQEALDRVFPPGLLQ